MKFWCASCEGLVGAPSIEVNNDSEASPHNGIGEHTHCDTCSNILTLQDVRDLLYISERMGENKIRLNEYGAQQVISGKPLRPSSVEELKQLRDEKEALIRAQTATFELKVAGIL